MLNDCWTFLVIKGPNLSPSWWHQHLIVVNNIFRLQHDVTNIDVAREIQRNGFWSGIYGLSTKILCHWPNRKKLQHCKLHCTDFIGPVRGCLISDFQYFTMVILVSVTLFCCCLLSRHRMNYFIVNVHFNKILWKVYKNS